MVVSWRPSGRRVGYEPGDDHQIIRQIPLADQSPSPHNNLHRFFVRTIYISKIKLRISKTRDTFRSQTKIPHFFSENDEEGRNQHQWSSATEQLPYGALTPYKLTISILCYMTVRDFTRNKFTTQMDSESFKEKLTKLR